jgi:hypothetical protein
MNIELGPKEFWLMALVALFATPVAHHQTP